MTVKAKAFETFIREFNASLPDDSRNRDKWTVSYKSLADAVELTAKQPTTGQQIVLVWDTSNNSEVYNYPESVYSRNKGDNPGEWTIRNVSEGRKIVQGSIKKGSESGRRGGRPRNADVADTPDTSSATPASPANGTPKPSRKRSRNAVAPGDAPVTDLPFDPKNDADDDILKAVSGKIVHYRRGAVMMKAHVHPKNLSMKKSKNAETPDRRFIQFASDEGFMTVYLDLIRKVTAAK